MRKSHWELSKTWVSSNIIAVTSLISWKDYLCCFLKKEEVNSVCGEFGSTSGLEDGQKWSEPEKAERPEIKLNSSMKVAVKSSPRDLEWNSSKGLNGIKVEVQTKTCSFVGQFEPFQKESFRKEWGVGISFKDSSKQGEKVQTNQDAQVSGRHSWMTSKKPISALDQRYSSRPQE